MSEQRMTKKVVALALLMLVGCARDPSVEMTTPDMRGDEVVPNDRFQVERVGVFGDGLAYNGRRGIYLIHDKETGREYFGVSGIGISEMDSYHQCTSTGKTTVCTTHEVER